MIFVVFVDYRIHFISARCRNIQKITSKHGVKHAKVIYTYMHLFIIYFILSDEILWKYYSIFNKNFFLFFS